MWMRSTSALALDIHDDMTDVLSNCWVSHAFTLRVGIGCPSEVADVLNDSLIFACIQPRSWHLTSVDKWQTHVIHHWFLIRFTFELALAFNQEWRMYLVIRWFVDALYPGIGIWHPSTLAYVFSNSWIFGRMLILHYLVFRVETKGDSAHGLVMDWAWTFAWKIAPATSCPGRRPSAARRSQEHPWAQQRDELVWEWSHNKSAQSARAGEPPNVGCRESGDLVWEWWRIMIKVHKTHA
jgi:hypothetical protein